MRSEALKDGVELDKIKENIIPSLLKVRMEIKDDEVPKLVRTLKNQWTAVQKHPWSDSKLSAQVD